MILTTRPIDAWPGTLRRDFDRTAGPFTAAHSSTLNDLDRELEALRATNPVLQMAITERDCRLDGQIRADARPTHPGVILAFDSIHGPLQYATDAFRSSDGWRAGRLAGWQQNLRAIARGLEALRSVDRYGISSSGEQYTGWKALGAGIPMPAAQMTTTDAAEFLIEHGEWRQVERRATVGEFLDCPEAWPAYYREAAKRLHPDAGGDSDAFRRLGEARDVLAGR